MPKDYSYSRNIYIYFNCRTVTTRHYSKPNRILCVLRLTECSLHNTTLTTNDDWYSTLDFAVHCTEEQSKLLVQFVSGELTYGKEWINFSMFGHPEKSYQLSIKGKGKEYTCRLTVCLIEEQIQIQYWENKIFPTSWHFIKFKRGSQSLMLYRKDRNILQSMY